MLSDRGEAAAASGRMKMGQLDILSDLYEEKTNPEVNGSLIMTVEVLMLTTLPGNHLTRESSKVFSIFP